MVETSMHTKLELQTKDKKIKVTISLEKKVINIIEQLQQQEHRTTSNTVETIILRWYKMKNIVENNPELYKILEPYIRSVEV